MSTGTTCQIKSSSSDDTLAAGERFGKRCRGGEVFVLSSDLGGGKTTFTKGLAKGLGSNDNVSSPTFTVSRVYKCRDNLYLHHFDFYRLNEGGMVAHELAEVVGEPGTVTVIEWGDIVGDVLPAERVMINFERSSEGEDIRTLIVRPSVGLSYICEGESTE